MKEKLRDYFTFTRKERLGVIVLLIIILILFIVPYWIRRPPGTEDPEATRQFAPLIEKFDKDSTGRRVYKDGHYAYQAAPDSGSGIRQIADRPSGPAALFYFDPNEMKQSDWQRLGLSERQSRTLVHYTEKGGRFRSPEDLGKIYGLSGADRDRLTPYVKIRKADFPKYIQGYSTPHSRRSSFGTDDPRPGNRRFAYFKPERRENRYSEIESAAGGRPESQNGYQKKTPVRIDVNQADSTAWVQLPGIGERLAARIIRFREKLGGFYAVEQVGETFGLPDSSFQKIKPWLLNDSAAVQRIDLNTVSGEVLRQHPYVRWKLANILLRYREQHGKFESVEELGQLALLDAETLQKLKPYLLVKN